MLCCQTGKKSDPRFGKGDGFGGRSACDLDGKNSAFCLLGGAGVGFSAWPSLPSADSGRGAGWVAKHPTDAGAGAGAEATARTQGSSGGVETLEIIPASASKFCKWQQFLQPSKLLQPDCLAHLKSWLWLKMFRF